MDPVDRHYVDRVAFERARKHHRQMLKRTRWIDTLAAVVVAALFAWAVYYSFSTPNHNYAGLHTSDGSPLLGFVAGTVTFVWGGKSVYRSLRGRRARRFVG